MRFVCSICGYVYDEDAEGTLFAALPESWSCPLCGAGKSAFSPAQAEPAQTGAQEARTQGAQKPSAHKLPPQDKGQAQDERDTAPSGSPIPRTAHDLERLPAGVISAICSNLARGCEKQYHEEEAALFREIASWYAMRAQETPQGEARDSRTPPDETGGSERLATLSALIAQDLKDGYPSLRTQATTSQDRGTLRICTWGEKVTRVLASLLDRYRREGESMLEGTDIWVCSVCGFTFVGSRPPTLCPVCKVPDWKFEKINGRSAA